MNKLKLLDVVATLKQIPVAQLTSVELDYASTENLPSGNVGTIVEVYEEAGNSQYLVEFADEAGREYAMATLKSDELLLHYEPTVT